MYLINCKISKHWTFLKERVYTPNCASCEISYELFMQVLEKNFCARNAKLYPMHSTWNSLLVSCMCTGTSTFEKYVDLHMIADW